MTITIPTKYPKNWLNDNAADPEKTYFPAFVGSMYESDSQMGVSAANYSDKDCWDTTKPRAYKASSDSKYLRGCIPCCSYGLEGSPFSGCANHVGSNIKKSVPAWRDAIQHKKPEVGVEANNARCSGTMAGEIGQTGCGTGDNPLDLSVGCARAATQMREMDCCGPMEGTRGCWGPGTKGIWDWCSTTDGSVGGDPHKDFAGGFDNFPHPIGKDSGGNACSQAWSNNRTKIEQRPICWRFDKTVCPISSEATSDSRWSDSYAPNNSKSYNEYEENNTDNLPSADCAYKTNIFKNLSSINEILDIGKTPGEGTYDTINDPTSDFNTKVMLDYCSGQLTKDDEGKCPLGWDICSRLSSTGKSGDICRDWKNRMTTGSKATDASIDKYTDAIKGYCDSTYPNTNAKGDLQYYTDLNDCACFKRSQDSEYQAMKKLMQGGGEDHCWWDTCRNDLGEDSPYLQPRTENSKWGSAKAYCPHVCSQIMNFSKIGGNVTIKDFNSKIACDNINPEDQTTRDGKPATEDTLLKDIGTWDYKPGDKKGGGAWYENIILDVALGIIIIGISLVVMFSYDYSRNTAPSSEILTGSIISGLLILVGAGLTTWQLIKS